MRRQSFPIVLGVFSTFVGAVLFVSGTLSASPKWLAGVAVGTVALIAIAIVTPRLPWLPVAFYWAELSFFDEHQLHFLRIYVHGVPLSAEDFGVLVLIVGTMAVLFTRPRMRLGRGVGWTLGILIILGWTTIGAAIGLLRGHQLYAIAIDIRVVVFLGIGYSAARLLIRAKQDVRAIEAIFVVALVGFAAQQGLVSARALLVRHAIPSAPIDAYRDITVPFFIAIYGVLFCVAYSVTGTGRGRLLAAFGSLAGFMAIGASFIRVAWLATATGLVVLGAVSGRRAVVRIGVACVVVGLLIVVTAEFVPFVKVLLQSAERRAIEAVIPSTSPYFVNTVDTRLQESAIALGHLHNPVDWLTGAGLGLIVVQPNPFQHDSLVWLVSKEGLIGAGIFILVTIVIPLAKGLKVMWHGLPPNQRLLLSILIGALVSDVVSGVGAGTFTYAPWMPVIGCTIAWIEQLTSGSQRSGTSSDDRAPKEIRETATPELSIESPRSASIPQPTSVRPDKPPI